MNDVAAHIETLKRLTGTMSDYALADHIGTTRTTVANWRRRGTIPHVWDHRLVQRYGASAAFHGRFAQAIDPQEDHIVFGLLPFFVQQFSVGYLDCIECGVLLAELATVLRRCVREIGFASLSPAEVYLILEGRIKTGAIPELREALERLARSAVSRTSEDRG